MNKAEFIIMLLVVAFAFTCAFLIYSIAVQDANGMVSDNDNIEQMVRHELGCINKSILSDCTMM